MRPDGSGDVAARGAGPSTRLPGCRALPVRANGQSPRPSAQVTHVDQPPWPASTLRICPVAISEMTWSAAVPAGHGDTGAVGQICAGHAARPADPVIGERRGLASIRQGPDPYGLVGIHGDRDGRVLPGMGDTDGAGRRRASRELPDELSGPQVPQRDIYPVRDGQPDGCAVIEGHADDPVQTHSGLLMAFAGSWLDRADVPPANGPVEAPGDDDHVTVWLANPVVTGHVRGMSGQGQGNSPTIWFLKVISSGTAREGSGRSSRHEPKAAHAVCARAARPARWRAEQDEAIGAFRGLVHLGRIAADQERMTGRTSAPRAEAEP